MYTPYAKASDFVKPSVLENSTLTIFNPSEVKLIVELTKLLSVLNEAETGTLFNFTIIDDSSTVDLAPGLNNALNIILVGFTLKVELSFGETSFIEGIESIKTEMRLLSFIRLKFGSSGSFTQIDWFNLNLYS